MSEIVLQTSNLTKRFKEVLAVDKLNMEIRKGEVFGFLGPNGAGKTTTIKMIMSLTHPTSGEVRINGQVASSNAIELRRDIGFLPERIAFYNNLTPIQTLSFFTELKGGDKSRIPELIKEVGLEEAANRKVGTFSKGMVQLLGVAQAMIGNPSLYIFDEPMSGLDARWVKMVRDKIRQLNESGATIIFSSHILTEVQALCDRVAIINNGRLIAEDTIAHLSEHMHIRPKLEITILGLNGIVPEILNGMPGIHEMSAENDKLCITCDNDARSKIITTLSEAGLNVEDFQTHEPTLEETFVKLVSEPVEGGDQ